MVNEAIITSNMDDSCGREKNLRVQSVCLAAVTEFLGSKSHAHTPTHKHILTKALLFCLKPHYFPQNGKKYIIPCVQKVEN